MVEKADAAGVPMGAILAPPNGDAAAPMFVVQALRDAAEKASPLQRIQMIKGWVDETGATREQVFEIAGDPDNGASVDPTTCERSGAGEDLLCSVWTDPTYISGQRAFYYARVVENPSCRWSAFLCNQLSAEDRPATCDEPDRPRTIQERAWTSPIWIEP